MSKLKIYKASAGSGKTYSLTEEYLKLAAIYPDNFKRILAVTFTNKAAEEMKQRILEALNQIIDKTDKAGFYNVFEQSYKNKSQFEIIDKVKTIRDSILHNYSYFSLSTIDSFVQKVIKSFTYEIGVESGYRIELDTDKVIFEITEMLYKQIDTDSKLRKWLIHFANYKIDEGKSWDFRSEIYKLAGEIFKEKFESTQNQKSIDEEYAEINKKFEILHKIKLSFEQRMNKLSTTAVQVFNNQSIAGKSLGRNITIAKNYFTKHIADNSKFEQYIPNKTLLGMIDNIDAWTAKSASAETKNLADEIYKQINPLLAEANKIIVEDFKYYVAAINVLSGFHAYGILRKLASLLPEYRSNNNLLMISDTTRLLKEIVAGNDAPFIYEKIGNKYKHILIDEFQDTSGFQWANFKPLILNNLSESQSNLIVGDIKQSIYRWRGGDWNLLLSQVDKDIGKAYIEHKTLETNWRSKKNIVDFNNSFFKIASDSLQNVFNSEINAGDKSLMDAGFENKYSDIITRAYSDTFQQLPDNKKDNKGGRVKIEFIEKGKPANAWKATVLENIPNTIEDLLQIHNYKPSDIAVLVRKNDEGQAVANTLLSYQNSNENALKYPIISSESLMLINSNSIQILINAMFYIFNPKDEIRLHALVTIYNQTFYPDHEIQHTHYAKIDEIEKTQLLPIDFLKKLKHLKRLNIFELTEELSNIFALNTLKGQLIYLQSFQDLVLYFINNNNTDVDSFVQWWEDKGKRSSIQLSDEQEALKILSIHKSKGLAFKVVLIPFCDWSLRPSTRNSPIVWTSSDYPPFDQLGTFPITISKQLANSILYKEYYEEILYSFIDAINMLYVAFTRAKEELLVIAPYSDSKTSGINSVSQILYSAIKTPLSYDNLLNLNDFFKSPDKSFELQTDYIVNDSKKSDLSGSDKSIFNINEYVLGDWESKIKIQHNADDFFAKSIQYIQDQIDYGTFMHKVLSKIKTPNDIESVVNEMYYAGKLSSNEKELLIDKVKEIINRPMVKDWFLDKWQVVTEDAILNNTGQIRIPDRVLIGENETIVIDYKFGEQYEESITQIKEYINLLQTMNYPNVKGYVYYVEKNVINEE